MLTDETTSLIRVVHEKLSVDYLVQEDPAPPFMDPHFHDCIHSSLLVDPVMSQMNPMLNPHTLVL